MYTYTKGNIRDENHASRCIKRDARKTEFETK